MIRIIYKTIWNEKRANAWIFIELVLIFSILFFCSDFLYKKTSSYIEPVGFDIKHTYNVLVGELPKEETLSLTNEDRIEAFYTIAKRIEKNPMIEATTYSCYATPYNGSYTSNRVNIDSIQGGVQVKYVSPTFFDVFKIPFISGNTFTDNDMVTQKKGIIGVFSDNKVFDVPYTAFNKVGYNDDSLSIIGFVNPVKRSEFENYHEILYLPFSEDQFFYNFFTSNISFRVKPEFDNDDFVEKFTSEMKSQLNISPYFFIKVNPVSSDKDQYMQWTGYDNKIKSLLSITSFLLINIFLGMIGTFWLRIQSRQSEIGLQMALGASISKIKQFYSLESLSILFLASIVGFILSVNILATGVFDNLGLFVFTKQELKDIDGMQLVINYFITLFILGLITLLAVWIPANRASKISPAVVLRSE